MNKLIFLLLVCCMFGCAEDTEELGDVTIKFQVDDDIDLKKFQVKKSFVVVRDQPHPTYHDAEIIIANYHPALNQQGTIVHPKSSDKVAFVIDIDNPKVGKTKKDFMVWVYKDETNYCLSGEKWGCNLSDYSGSLTIDEYGKNRVKGKIHYAHKDGSFIKANFDVPVKSTP